MAERSVDCYRTDTELFLEYLQNNNIQDIRTEHIYDWMKYLRDLGNNENTIARKLAAIRKYLRYLVIRQDITENPAAPVRNVSRSKARSKHAASQTAQKLLETTLPYKGLVRDAAIVALTGMAGMRVSEITALRMCDLRPTKEGILIRAPNRKIHLRDREGEIVRALWEERQKLHVPDDGPVFCGIQNKPMSRQGVWKALRRRAERMGVDPSCGPSHLRGAYVRKLLAGNVSKKTVAHAVGLRCTESLQAYRKSTPDGYRGG